MPRISRLKIASEVPPEDRQLAQQLSTSATIGDPDPATVSNIEVERAWRAIDELDSASIPGLIRLSDRLGVRVPEAFRSGATDKLFGPPRPDRRTRVVCTVGPACADVDTLAKMIDAGMDVARLNFSHIDGAADAQRWVGLLDAAMAKAGRTITLMADLRGPKLRIGKLAGATQLVAGHAVTLGEGGQLPLSPPAIVADLKDGDRLFIDDGRVELVVRDASETPVKADVLRGGVVTSMKGLNLPDTKLSGAVPTAKDLADIEIIESLGIDRVAVSFVESAVDVERFRKAFKHPVQLIAKVERPAAVVAIEEIMAAADGVMVARGDGAVEMGDAEMPVIQRQIHSLGNRQDVPTGTATQMMESMNDGGRPSRADASDVARAAIEGSDFVMTSGETAMGSDPIGVIEAMAKILATTERAIRTGTVQSLRR